MSRSNKEGRCQKKRNTRTKNKLKPPKIPRVASPILEKMKSSPGGPHTPGEKAKRKKK